MHITLSESIGSAGVFMLLLAFVFNLATKNFGNTIGYIVMNVVGAGLACYASYLISYVPFIILEGVWTIVSLVAFINYCRKRIM